MLPFGRLLTSRTVAALKISVAMFVAWMSAAACSFIIGDSLPHFACSPGQNTIQVCPSGSVCVQVDNQRGQCISINDLPPDATIGSDGSVVDGTVSDATDDSDTELGAASAADAGDAGVCAAGGVGCPCNTPGETEGCEGTTAGFCVARQIVAAGYEVDAGSSPGVCTKACCTSADCDKGSVCYATGAGGNYCLPNGAIGDRSTAGSLSGPGGQPCDAGGSCRSGLCSPTGFCADTCCSTSATPPRMMMQNAMPQCVMGTGCRLGLFSGSSNDMAYVPRCYPVTGAAGNGAPCASNSDCKSNLCVNDTPQTQTCRDPCRRPEDCTGTGNMQMPQECEYVQLGVTGLSSDLVAVCVPLMRSGPAPDGGVPDWGQCTASSDCARGYCAPSGDGPSVCVSVCFGDGDCVGGGTCRPQRLQLGGAIYNVLACK